MGIWEKGENYKKGAWFNAPKNVFRSVQKYLMDLLDLMDLMEIHKKHKNIRCGLVCLFFLFNNIMVYKKNLIL